MNPGQRHFLRGSVRPWSVGKVWPHKLIPLRPAVSGDRREDRGCSELESHAHTRGTKSSLVFSGGDVGSWLPAFLMFQETPPGQIFIGNLYCEYRIKKKKDSLKH